MRINRLAKFLADDKGQELVEYALLCVCIGVVSILIWQNVVVLLGDRYTDYNTNVPQYWESPPISGS